MRTKYGEYKEYHTSLDKLGTVVTGKGLYGGYLAAKKTLDIIENNILDGQSFEEAVKTNNLRIIEFNKINAKKENEKRKNITREQRQKNWMLETILG